METLKKGISLIVLVITVIVLAILATTVIVSISNTNIITKANDAVTEYNLKTYEDQLNIAYASWLLDNSGDTLEAISDLETHGFDEDSLPDGYGAIVKNGKPIIILLDVWDGTSVATSFSGGTGTEGDPYLISSAAELAYLAQGVNAGTLNTAAYYELTSNIDLNNKAWTPIGSGSYAFLGDFDGNNYTIYNLNVSLSSGFAGLFGTVGDYEPASGTSAWYGGISNLTIEGGTVSGTNAAALVGPVKCSNINNCHNINVTVNATGEAAGIAFGIDYGTLYNCTNSGNVTGGTATGISKNTGIGGRADNCINYGNITATSERAAGIFSALTDISDATTGCYNYGDIHGVTLAAGIAVHYEALPEYATFNNDSYNYGTVTVEDGGEIWTLDEATN